MQDLRGKTAVITGASAGIGRAAALRLAALGLRLALVARSTDRLEALRAEIDPNGTAGHLVIRADMSQPSEATRAVEEAIAAFGHLDILLANAGIYLPGDLVDAAPEAMDDLINVNVTAVFRSVRAALPAMIAAGSGDVLVTSSVSGHQAIQWEPVYSASKHAIQSFVHGVRRQVNRHNVRVGAIAPGIVYTDIWGGHSEEEIATNVAAKAGMRAEDVVEAMVFMLSQPRHVTIRDLVMLPTGQDI